MFAKTALAIAIAIARHRAHLLRPRVRHQSANDVYVNGKYVGSDPDPTIRSTPRVTLKRPVTAADRGWWPVVWSPPPAHRQIAFANRILMRGSRCLGYPSNTMDARNDRFA